MPNRRGRRESLRPGQMAGKTGRGVNPKPVQDSSWKSGESPLNVALQLFQNGERVIFRLKFLRTLERHA
jgi:hypothetical protein